MMDAVLKATICQTHKREPLAVVGLPGGEVELTPVQLRALADALLRVAADADAAPMTVRRYAPKRKEYRL